MGNEIFTGINYNKYRSGYDYFNSPKDAIITTIEEIQQLKEMEESGKYIIYLRLRITGEYTKDWNKDFSTNYMYMVKAKRTEEEISHLKYKILNIKNSIKNLEDFLHDNNEENEFLMYGNQFTISAKGIGDSTFNNLLSVQIQYLKKELNILEKELDNE